MVVPMHVTTMVPASCFMMGGSAAVVMDGRVALVRWPWKLNVRMARMKMMVGSTFYVGTSKNVDTCML